MDILYFVGIDISKTTLDWAVYDGKKVVLQTASVNTVAGIKTALRLLKKLPSWNRQQTVFCMEHTGIYNAHLLDFLHKLHFPICGAARAVRVFPVNQERTRKNRQHRCSKNCRICPRGRPRSVFEISFDFGNHLGQ
jgi:transposase